ncbi:hypothetical protein [Crenothrix sp.]|uniref:hypothetical protein n=1 Tax=Crenothrix sp. TaxID=3100433 RepID=UPI00374D5986
MNIVEGRSNLRRLSVPRRTAQRDEGGDRRQCDRRQEAEGVDKVEENDQDTQKKYVRVSVTPGERTLLQDMYLIEDE